MGELLYSLPLAPCEETKIAIIEWSRSEKSSRSEIGLESEQLSHEMFRNRDVLEAVGSVLNEMQSGSSWNTGEDLD